jgi:EpsI family protein
MTRNDNRGQRAVIIAALAASFIMCFFSVGYRVLAAKLDAPGDAEPISPEALERFPIQLGDWTGQEVPLDEAVVRATDTDAHISRNYIRHNGSEAVWFYVACGVRTRDLTPHRPEVCYTGAGWTLIDRQLTELPLSNDMKLPCNVMQFSRGTLNKKKVVVLDYYIVDGEYCPDVSLLRWKAVLGSGTVRYAAQVQVVASVTPSLDVDSAANLVCAFAVESASSISELFNDNEEEPRSDQEPNDANEVFGETASD